MARIALQRPLKNKSPTNVHKDEGTERQSAGASTSLRLSFSLSLCLIILTACAASTQPIVKIGLVAPFEGRYRAIGYEAIYAARLAIREINAQGGLNGRRVELVALDDRGEPAQAIEAARQLALDPQVIAVIGHLRPDTTVAAQAVYCAAGLPNLAVEITAAPCAGTFALGAAPRDRWPDDRQVFVSNVPDPNNLPAAQAFVAKYNAIPIDGVRAGPIALQTYDAISLIFEALHRAPNADRVGVKTALAHNQFSGLGADYAFDSQGNLIEPHTYVFDYGQDRQPRLLP